MALAATKPRLSLKTILIATDFSPASENAMLYATGLARHYGSTIVLAHVQEEVPMTSVPMDYLPSENDLGRGQALERMHKLAADPAFSGIQTETVVESGFIWPVLAKLVNDKGVDLLVLGTHGRGALRRVILGSVAEEISRHATCPVLTIGPHVRRSDTDRDHFNKIMVATDFSEGSLAALPYASALAEEHNARLVLLHVVLPPGVPLDVTDQMVSESEVKLRSIAASHAFGQKPIFATVVGIPGDQILAVAKRDGVDLIVMGMHKAAGFGTHWPFAVTSHVIAKAECPVLTVHA